MGAKITFDATNRKFVVTEPPDVNGRIVIDLQVDLYSDGKEDWQNDATYPELSGMQFPVDAIGGNAFGAKTLAVSYLIKHGWSFKPYEADHTMVLQGNIGTQQGWELVDDTVGSYRVRVENDVSSITTLENASFLEASTFYGRVTIDPNSPYSGVNYPVGTHTQPVNNIPDALAIATNRGLNTLHFERNMTIGATATIANYIIEGTSPVTVTLTVDAAADVQSCEFRNIAVTGTLDGGNIIRQALVTNVTNFTGFLFQAGLQGTIGLGAGQASIFDCYSNVPGGGPGQFVNLDFNDADVDVAMRNYSGGISIVNCTGTSDSSYDMSSGRIVFDASTTSGEHTVRGIGDVYDNSSANVYDLTTTRDTRRGRKLLSNRQELVDLGSEVVIRTWDDDGVTTLEENVVTDPNDNEPTLTTGSVTKRAAPS